jgi:hypothetical protein
MRLKFAMSSVEALQEAADWLEGLGCLAESDGDDSPRRLVVAHGADLHREVVRIVAIVDSDASEIRG